MKVTPEYIGRYVIRERLAHGGMGVLYLARDPAIDRPVALKVLAVQNPELRERFLREAGLAGRLQHPNIVTVYDVGAHEGQPFIAMEYIDGETLADLIQRRPTLPLKRKLELIEDACKGLTFAHRSGIVHRDVKPANLMIRRDGGALKVLDFGIARGMDSSLTQAGMVMGTPNYMSPEQLEGRPLDQRSDVFSLGVVLYELLSYRQAFTGETPQAVWTQISTRQPTPLPDLVPNMEPTVVAIVERAMAKKAEDRYADLEAMRLELQRVIHRIESVQAGDTLVEAVPIPVVPLVRRPDLVRLAERRAAQIAANLKRAEEAFAARELERAQEATEEAALLDPDDPRVLILLDRIRREVDAREVAGLVAEADAAIKAGSLTSASGLLSRALQLMPGHVPAVALQSSLQQAIDARERNQERARAVSRALQEAEQHLASGAPDAAMRAASEALGYDPTHAAALALKARVQEKLQQRVEEALTQARADYTAGRLTAALRRLESLRPRDERIEALEAEVRQAWLTAQAQRSGAPTARLQSGAVPRPAIAEPPPSATPPPSPAVQAPVPSPTPAAPALAASPVAPEPAVPVAAPSGARPAAVAGPSPVMRNASHTLALPLERRHAKAVEYLERARTLLSTGDFARSISLVDAALVIDPTPDAHTLRQQIDQAWADVEIGRARAAGQA